MAKIKLTLNSGGPYLSRVVYGLFKAFISIPVGPVRGAGVVIPVFEMKEAQRVKVTWLGHTAGEGHQSQVARF